MSGLRRVEWPWEFKRTCIPSNKKIGAARRAIGSQGGGARGPEKRGEVARQLAHLARLDAGEEGAGGLDPVVCRPLQGCFDDVRLEAEVVGGAARLDLPGLRALALLLGAARHFRLRLAREAARLLRREERFRERGRDRGARRFSCRWLIGGANNASVGAFLVGDFFLSLSARNKFLLGNPPLQLMEKRSLALCPAPPLKLRQARRAVMVVGRVATRHRRVVEKANRRVVEVECVLLLVAPRRSTE